MEEGEIINSDSDFQYEAISSDEEISLRQQIEALEAKNREMAKIASISAKSIDYGKCTQHTFDDKQCVFIDNQRLKW